MKKLAVLMAVCFAGTMGATPAGAQDAGGWLAHDSHVRTRIVAADVKGETVYGWEAEMAPGWKTYWRSPGEAGLPVTVAVDGNPVEPLYPLPHRFELFGLVTYGYDGRLILPFKADAAAGDPVSVGFMVCKDICIPYDGSYSLPATEGGATAIRMEAALKAVPDRDGDGGAGLEISKVQATGQVGHERLIVTVRGADALDAADLLVEGDEAIQFGVAERRLMEGGMAARFVVPTALTRAGEKAGLSLKGQTVRLTFTDGRGHAIDRSIAIP